MKIAQPLLLLLLPLLAVVCPASANLDIHCLNVGAGEATLIVSPSGQTMLVDGGRNGKGNSVVIPFLESLGITSLTYVVATHMGLESIGGLDEVAHAFMPAVAYDNGGSLTSRTYWNYESAISAVRQTIAPGQVINLGEGVTVTCICADGVAADGSGLTIEDENDRSVGLLVEYDFFRFWVSGDLGGGELAQEDMESFVSPLIGDIDVLRVNHNGSDSSTNIPFLSDVQPEVAVISVENANPDGNPAQGVLDRLGNQESVHAIVQTTAGCGNYHPKASVMNDHIRIRVRPYMYSVSGGAVDIRVPRAAPISPSDLCEFLKAISEQDPKSDLNDDGVANGRDLHVLAGLWKGSLALKVPTPGPSPTPSMTGVPTDTPTLTPTVTSTNTAEPTATRTLRLTPKPTWTYTPGPTEAFTATRTPPPIDTPTRRKTPTQTGTESLTRTRTPTSTDAGSPTATGTEVFYHEMVDIPAGSFMMGNAGTERDQDACASTNSCSKEEPRHLVTIDYSFQMGKYEVTNALYAEVLNEEFSNRGHLFGFFEGLVKYRNKTLLDLDYPFGGCIKFNFHTKVFFVAYSQDNHPVVAVSKYGAMAFCNWLSEKEGLPVCYDLSSWKLTDRHSGGYRLPSESEWEYACRGPSSNPDRYAPFSFGDRRLGDYVVYSGNHRNFWGAEEVGSKSAPHAWGMHLMHGNVYEICQDSFHSNYDGSGRPDDGSPWLDEESSSLVLRGGSAWSRSLACRSSYRTSGMAPPATVSSIVGFRLARTPQ